MLFIANFRLNANFEKEKDKEKEDYPACNFSPSDNRLQCEKEEGTAKRDIRGIR